MLENFFVYMIANFSNKKIITYVGWTNNLKKDFKYIIAVRELNLLEAENGS